MMARWSWSLVVAATLIACSQQTDEHNEDLPSFLIGHGDHLLSVDRHNQFLVQRLPFPISKMAVGAADTSVVVASDVNHLIYEVSHFRRATAIRPLVATDGCVADMIYDNHADRDTTVYWLDCERKRIMEYNVASQRLALHTDYTNTTLVVSALLWVHNRLHFYANTESDDTVADEMYRTRKQLYSNAQHEQQNEIIRWTTRADGVLERFMLNGTEVGRYSVSANAMAIACTANRFLTLTADKTLEQTYFDGAVDVHIIARLSFAFLNEPHETFLFVSEHFTPSDYPECPASKCVRSQCVRTAGACRTMAETAMTDSDGHTSWAPRDTVWLLFVLMMLLGFLLLCFIFVHNRRRGSYLLDNVQPKGVRLTVKF